MVLLGPKPSSMQPCIQPSCTSGREGTTPPGAERIVWVNLRTIMKYLVYLSFTLKYKLHEAEPLFTVLCLFCIPSTQPMVSIQIFVDS